MDPHLVRNEIHRLTCEVEELRNVIEKLTGERIGADHPQDSLAKSRARKWKKQNDMRMPDGRPFPDRQS